MNYCYKIFFILCLLTGMHTYASGQLLLQEDFSYTAASDLAGQGSWTEGSVTTTNLTISNSGLTYSGYAGSGIGNALTLPGGANGDRDQKTFTATLSGTWYWAFLVKVDSTKTSDYFIGNFSNNAFRARTYIKEAGIGLFNFGLCKTSTATSTSYTTETYSIGTTYLVVVKYKFNTGSGTDDAVSLFVNPVLGAAEPTPTLGPLTDTGNDISAAALAIQTRTNCGTLTLDGIRVANDWATAVPNPPYYYVGSGALNDVNNWGVNNDGSGSHPTNFTANDQSFYVGNVATVGLSTNWSVSGTNSKVVVSSATNLTIPTGYSIAGTVDVATGGTLTITHNNWPTFGSNSGTVSFDNSSGFIMAGDVTVPVGSGDYVMTNGNIDVGGNILTVNGKLTTGANIVMGSGAFILGPTGTLRISLPVGIVSSGASGVIQTDTRTFDAAASYIYDGAGSSLVTGNALPATIGSITVSLANATDILTLTNSLATTGNVTLTKGLLRIGNNNLTVGNPSGGSALSYVITNGTGNVIRSVTSTSLTAKTFHVGSATEYRKIVVTFPSTTGIATATNLNVKYTGSNPGTAGYLSSLTSHYVGGYWTASMDATPINTYNVDIDITGIGGITDPSLLRVIKRANNSSAWDVAGAAFSYAAPVLTETTISGFSEFTVGSTGTANPLPVELTSFIARMKAASIELAWTTATEKNNRGFEIQRSSSSEEWKVIGFVDGAGTSNAQHSYAFTDQAAAGKYLYRLKQIDNDGKSTYSTTVEAVVALTAGDYTLGQNYPNPFNPTTNINFALKNAEHATVTIYNMLGQNVATLFNEEAAANRMYTLTFDAKNLPSGIYFYSLRSASRNEVKKMQLMK